MPKTRQTQTEEGRSQNDHHTHHRTERLSPAAENYLLSLYMMWEEGFRSVTVAQLAESLKSLPESEGLGTTLPSVTGMVRRMEREGLLETGKQKDIHLTEKGFQGALDMVRRHRIAERMVTDLLGLELPRAHQEAHRLEHAISPELLAKIEERLGYPTTCPFGRPIPGSGYQPPEGEVVTLAQAVGGQWYVVDRVPEEDEALVQFLVDHQMLPGHRLLVKEAAAYRGVLTVECDGEEATMGYQVAGVIWVYPAP